MQLDRLLDYPPEAPVRTIIDTLMSAVGFEAVMAAIYWFYSDRQHTLIRAFAVSAQMAQIERMWERMIARPGVEGLTEAGVQAVKTAIDEVHQLHPTKPQATDLFSPFGKKVFTKTFSVRSLEEDETAARLRAAAIPQRTEYDVVTENGTYAGIVRNTEDPPRR